MLGWRLPANAVLIYHAVRRHRIILIKYKYVLIFNK